MSMTAPEIEKILLNFPDTHKEYLPDETTAVYKVGEHGAEGKIYALVTEKSKPLQISLKCDSQLAVTLRLKFETVLPALDMNKKYWNKIILTGQLPDEDVTSLIILSYNMVRGESLIASR